MVTSDRTFGIFWSHLWYLLIPPLVSSDLTFGIIWSHLWYLLIPPLTSSDPTCGNFKLFLHCIYFKKTLSGRKRSWRVLFLVIHICILCNDAIEKSLLVIYWIVIKIWNIFNNVFIITQSSPHSENMLPYMLAYPSL